MEVIADPVVMRVRKPADLLGHGWRVNIAGLLAMVVLAVVMGTGLAHAFGDGPASRGGVPLAAPSDAPDLATWTAPLSSPSFYRLSDGRQRLGQLLALAQPRADRAAPSLVGATATIGALILLRLLARRHHGVRAPPFRPIPAPSAGQHPVRRPRS